MTHVAKYRIEIGPDFKPSVEDHESVVVIDNLRASSTIVTALGLGVDEIIPVQDDEEAFVYKERGYFIAGESGGSKIDGYDAGNSPVEIAEHCKTSPHTRIVLKTSNLIPLLSRLKRAYICSSLNLASVAGCLAGQHTCIIAAGGKHGAVEDLGLAFALCAQLTGVRFDPKMLTSFTKESAAAHHLCSIGYGSDIEFICRASIFDVVPVYDGTKIVKAGAMYDR